MAVKYLIFLVITFFLFAVNNVVAVEDNLENEAINNQINIKNRLNNLTENVANFLSDKSADNLRNITNNQTDQVVASQTQAELVVETDQTKSKNQASDNGVGAGQNQASKNRQQFAGDRRSEVAQAVQEILDNVESSQTVGEQIREIARQHTNNHENLASHLARIQNQNKFIRFIFGPEPQAISAARKILKANQQYLGELESMKNLIESSEDQVAVEQAINQLATIEFELAQMVTSSTKGFSLLGWLINLLSSKE